MKQMNRFWLIISLVCIAAVAVGFALWLPKDHALLLSGLVQAREVKSASSLGGRVAKLLVKEGQEVTAGTPLLQFDVLDWEARLAEAEAALIQAQAKKEALQAAPDDIRQAQSQVQQAQQSLQLAQAGARPEEVTQARARLQEAQSRLSLAQTRLEQGQKLLAEGVISPQRLATLEADVDSAQSAVKVADGALKILQSGSRKEQIAIARSQLMSAQAQLNKLTHGPRRSELKFAEAAVAQAASAVTALKNQRRELEMMAPVSGIVSVLNANPGELIQPGRPIATIIDYENVWTDVYVPESQLGRVKIRQAVKVVCPAYNKTQYQGQVVFINPKSEYIPGGGINAANEESSFRVRVALTGGGDQPLLPGMKVQVEFPSL
jgi:multidrug resistance efflux pump